MFIASANYLVRHADGSYEVDDADLVAPHATRTLAISPFPADQGAVVYAGGYDCDHIEEALGCRPVFPRRRRSCDVRRHGEAKMTRSTLASVAFALIGAACAGAPIARDRLTDPGALLYNGYSNPAVDCYKCHGGDGSGAFLRGPGLADRVPSLTPEQIAEVIQKGKGHMPSFSEKLTRTEIDQIVAWLKASFPPPPSPKS